MVVISGLHKILGADDLHVPGAVLPLSFVKTHPCIKQMACASLEILVQVARPIGVSQFDMLFRVLHSILIYLGYLSL